MAVSASERSFAPGFAAIASAAVQTTPPRQRIIDAAIACFARSGFHGASVGEICAEAGMSPGALYRYFPSKVSIISAIAESEREQHAAFFERMAGADDPVEALTSIGIDTLDACLAGPKAALNAETVAEAIRNPEVRSTFRRNIDEAQRSVVEALQRGQHTGTVDPSLDVEAAAQLIIALGDGLAAHQALNPAAPAARLRPAIETLLRRFLRPVGAALLFLFAAGSAWSASPPQVVEPRPPAVTVVEAEFGPIAEKVGLTGTVVPREEVLVSPQIGDLAITEVLAEEGDSVAAGQVLARLARDQLDASLAQSAAAVARAEAAIAQARAAIAESQAEKVRAELALARTRELAGRGDAARETLEQRQATAQVAAAKLEANQNLLRAAEADLAMAQAQRREWEVKLSRTEIRAPVAGVVSRRTARLGAVVQGVGEPLFRLVADGAVELEADVPEVLIAKLRPGQAVQVETIGGTRPGIVRLVSPEVNRTTRLGRVRVGVAGTAPLAIGSFGRAEVKVARHEGVLVPLSAVLFQPGGAVVQVVRDGRVETRAVTLGLQARGQAEIIDGVRPGEDVVATSGSFIRGGDRVTAVPRS